MTDNLPTVWMNVTTSANWKRPPVGIVRVEHSLSTELQKIYGENFRYCIWHENAFVELPSLSLGDEQTTETQGKINNRQIKQESELPPIYPLLQKKQALIALAQVGLSLTPHKIRPHINRLLYSMKPLAARLLARGRQAFLARRHSKAITAGSPAGQHAENCQAGRIFSPGDVFISVGLDWDYPYYKHFYYFKKDLQVKMVTCCYDLIPVLYPQYCVGSVAGIFTSYFLEIADGSDLVLCISKQSEKDLHDLLNRTGGARVKTHVFPLGDNVLTARSNDISTQISEVCKSPFILFVSSIERRKNHEVLYRAYHLLCSEGKGHELPKLLFVGMPGWGVNDLLKDIEFDPLTQGLIVQLNHVTDSELRTLYEAALFCVFPSFYEGWGLPVGEALSMGKAVIASAQGSLPEVGGDLVCYADPWDPREWADKMFRMATEVQWREAWMKKIKTNYNVKLWSGAAYSVEQAIRQIRKEQI